MAANDKVTSSLIVADAGPLIHLDELDALDLLTDCSRVLVPDAVWVEVTKHRPIALENHGICLEKVTPLPANLALQAVGRLYTLHQGEWEALAVCSQYPGSRLLTDDTAARLAANALSISANGTLGVLLRSVRCQRRTKDQLIAMLKAISSRTTLHIRPSLLSQIISEVDSL